MGPEYFGRIYLSHLLTNRTSEFHHTLYELTKEDRVAIAAPRSFAKSTVFSYIYACWAALYGIKKDILLVSATGTLAEEWLRRIKDEMDTNPLILEDFGMVKSTKWTEAHIILANKSQIRAKGAGYQIRGFRPDCVICDDLENDERVRSKDQRAKMEDWFWKSLVNTLNPKAQLIVVGTIIHPLSFLNELLKGKKGWITIKFKAIKDNGEALWPEKWSLELLMERKEEIGERRFRSEFLNDPLADDAIVFRIEWVDPHIMGMLPKKEELDFITAVDPAVSKKAAADNTAIVTIAIHRPTRHIYVADARHGKWSVYETVEQIIKVYEMFRPKRVIIEETAYQSALREVFTKESRTRNLYIPVHAANPDKDKVRRAHKIEHLFEQGLVHLLIEQIELRAELVLFPNAEHDDLVDALVWALTEVQDNKALVSRPKIAATFSGPKPIAAIIDIERAKRPKRRRAWYNL